MPRRTSSLGWSWGSLAMVGLVAAAAAFPAGAADSPVIRIDGLQQGAAYSGPHVPFIIAFRAKALDRRVTRLEISIDGKIIDQKIHVPAAAEGAFKVDWDTTAWADGKHTITVRAYDEAGESNAFSLHVYVNNNGPDLIAPKIRVTHPTPGQEISGRVPVRVKVEDNVGIQWVVIYVDKDFKHITNAPPYLWEWDTSREENGSHEVWAQAIDASDLESESERIPVIVNNPGAAGNLTRIQGRLPTEALPPAVPVVPFSGPTASAPRPFSLPRGQSKAPAPGVSFSGELAPNVVRQPAASPPLLSLALPARFAAGLTTCSCSKARLPLFGPAGFSQPTTSDSPRLADFRRELYPQVSLPSPLMGSGGVEAATSFSPSLSRPRAPQSSRGESFLPPSGPTVEPTPAVSTPGSPMQTEHRRPRTKAEASPLPSPLPEGRDSQGPRLSSSSFQPSVQESGTAFDGPLPAGSRQIATLPPLSPRIASRLRATERQESAPASPTNAVEGTAPVAGQATGGPPGPALGKRAPQVGATAPRPNGPPQMASDSRPVPLASPPILSIPGQIQTRRLQPIAFPKASSQIVGQVHVVQAGENVYRIARKYHTTVEQIAKINRLGRDYRIRPGQRLVLPQANLKGIFFNQRPVAMDVAPFQQRGISVAPFRHIFEHQGGVVRWKHASKELEARDEKRTIHLTIGSREAEVNQEKILMDLAAFIEQGRTMVPLRFIGQALDVTVQVDPDSGNIYLTANP